jgi:hypothetical protein
MKSQRRIIFSTLVVLMVFSLFVGPTNAISDNEESWQVDIVDAEYLDLDSDMAEDDVRTKFEVEVPSGEWTVRYTYIYAQLTLPSGYYFDYSILVVGEFSKLTLTLGWYNSAIESGWYSFRVDVFSFGGNTPDSGYDSVLFDPPTDGDPDVPLVEILDATVEI